MTTPLLLLLRSRDVVSGSDHGLFILCLRGPAEPHTTSPTMPREAGGGGVGREQITGNGHGILQGGSQVERSSTVTKVDSDEILVDLSRRCEGSGAAPTMPILSVYLN